MHNLKSCSFFFPHISIIGYLDCLHVLRLHIYVYYFIFLLKIFLELVSTSGNIRSKTGVRNGSM